MPLVPRDSSSHTISNNRDDKKEVIRVSIKQTSINIREGDTLIVPERTNSVFVYGEVSSEGAVAYTPNEGVEYFVNKSGGYKRFADNESIYILHPNGETQRYARQRNLFANEPRNLNMYPGSVIFIPRKLDNTATRRLAAQAYVSILGNLGIALASLSAISDD